MDIDINEELLTTLLLNSLPDSYDNFSGNMRCRDKLPNPDECKIKILEEFERRKSRTKRDEQAMLAAKRYYSNKNTNNKPSSSQNDQSKGKSFPFRCSKCGETGNKAADCPLPQDQGQKRST